MATRFVTVDRDTALLCKAEEVDATPLEEGLTIPAEVQRRQPAPPAYPPPAVLKTA